jgi:hypothetical protein
MMTGQRTASTGPDASRRYQIRLQGGLSREWAEWFDGLTITATEDGDTLLTGAVADQAALHGLLKKVRDLGLTLISVVHLPPDDGPDAAP